jgi:DivIVA domain-containing protein
MALTPEDVVNKRFQSTKFREGYDQDEVDDFLDEIVVELRRLNQENDELRQRLVAADARIAELQRGAAAAPAAPAEAAAVMPDAFGAALGAEPSADTNNLLQLARRLHEEHVREGMAKKEALIAEGQAEAARIVASAANAQQGQLQALEQEHVALQQRVNELRTFEREYRQQLRTYIQGQLAELDGSSQPAAAPASAPAYGSAPMGSAPVMEAPAVDPYAAASPAYPGSAPSYPAAPAQAYPAPQTPPPGQFPGYGS